MKPLTRSGRRGQSLVEFALILPIALIMLLAVFDVGRAVFMYNGLTNAAREGARLAIVNQDTTLVEQRVAEMAATATLSNASDPGDPVVAYRKQLPNDDVTTNPACTPLATGCVAVVTAKATWSAITPVIGALIGPIDLTARSELPIELVCPNPAFPAYATSADCPRQP
jgi:Flp pilus assembly protein TadG